MKLEFESILMADGEMLEDAVGDVPEDFLEAYVPCTVGGDEIYISPEAIISFKLKTDKPKIYK